MDKAVAFAVAFVVIRHLKNGKQYYAHFAKVTNILLFCINEARELNDIEKHKASQYLQRDNLSVQASSDTVNWQCVKMSKGTLQLRMLPKVENVS